MPRQVDHDQRRRQIAEALWRLASNGGLEAASVGEVAAEAGMSKGLVQHYFRTREEMLAFASTYLRDRVEARVQRRLASLPKRATPRAMLRALIVGLLPIDAASRTETLVASAMFVWALRHPALGARFRQGQGMIAEAVAAMMSAAQQSGELRADVDVGREAGILVALADGLATAILTGHHTATSAVDTVDYHLARLSPSRASRGRRTP